MNIFSRNEWLRLSDSILADISELNDNKFAVINGTHIDYTVYRCVKLTVSVITLYEADECYNMSEAGAEYMKEEFIKVVYVFFGEEEEDKATSYFVSLINDLLYGNNISNYNVWSQIRENKRQNEKRECKVFCTHCSEELTHEPRHDVAVILQLEDGSLEVDEAIVCSECLFEKFAYCRKCETWYEKQNVDEAEHICHYCTKKEEANE